MHAAAIEQNGMAIYPDKLLNRDFGILEQTYTEKDTIL
jgi:hypothetical protein